jgi:MerR family transcriptional regulator, mercuric resistance operon regulatory protein
LTPFQGTGRTVTDVDALTLGGLAREAGVNPETIRYYERRGLLSEPPRTASGYRQYSPDDRDRLALIRRAKALGFTLAEIGALLGEGAAGSTSDVLAAAREKLAEVDSRIAALTDQARRLRELLRACEAGSTGCGSFTIGRMP